MLRIVGLSIALAVAGGVAVDEPQHLVACAPGYPGDTQQAKPTMDELASRLARAAGVDPAGFSAEYHATEQEGLARLRDAKTTLALVPLPFFLAHEEELGLAPLAQIVRRDGSASERWSLVAPRDRIRAAADLAGWELQSIAAYAPGFVRGPALGSWGAIGADVDIVQPRRLLAALRRAAAGENVALLLDQDQADALDQLPDATSLQVVFSSEPVPAGLVATVGDRLAPADRDRLRRAFLQLSGEPSSAELMETLRLSAFTAVDEVALQRVREAYRNVP